MTVQISFPFLYTTNQEQNELIWESDSYKIYDSIKHNNSLYKIMLTTTLAYMGTPVLLGHYLLK